MDGANVTVLILLAQHCVAADAKIKINSVQRFVDFTDEFTVAELFIVECSGYPGYRCLQCNQHRPTQILKCCSYI